MARPRYPKSSGPLPPPLPPETRTVGQLVAETLRLYGRNVWVALAIGLPAAVLNVAATGLSRTETLAIVPGAGAVLVTISFVAASAVVTGAPLRSRHALTAFLVGAVVYVPFPFLAVLFVLPGLAWFALVGLAVPAALLERLGFRAALRRGVQLGRADYVHALGGLATLTILVFMAQIGASLLLQNYADNSERLAAFIAGLVLSPLLFLGGALLYVDQAARAGVSGSGVGSERPGSYPSRSERRANADLPDVDDADREGGADAEVEPRPLA
jgi:hypothetical protein